MIVCTKTVVAIVAAYWSDPLRLVGRCCIQGMSC